VLGLIADVVGVLGIAWGGTKIYKKINIISSKSYTLLVNQNESVGNFPNNSGSVENVKISNEININIAKE